MEYWVYMDNYFCFSVFGRISHVFEHVKYRGIYVQKCHGYKNTINILDCIIDSDVLAMLILSDTDYKCFIEWRKSESNSIQMEG